MDDQPEWEDRYHPKRIHSSGSAPKGWADEFRFCPYVREDVVIAREADLSAERDAALARERALLDSNDANRQALLGANAAQSGFAVETLGEGYTPKAPRFAGWMEWGAARKVG